MTTTAQTTVRDADDDAARDAAEAIVRTLSPHTVLDASSGGERVARALQDWGVDVTPLQAAAGRSYDLGLWLDVDDDLADDAARATVTALAEHTPVVLMSPRLAKVALPRPPIRWIERFAAAGLHMDPAAPWFRGIPGAAVFGAHRDPLPADARRALAMLLAERCAGARSAARLAAAQASAAADADRLAKLERDQTRSRAEIRGLREALSETTAALQRANVALQAEVRSVRVAETTLDRDLAALHASRLWRFKMFLSGRRTRERA